MLILKTQDGVKAHNIIFRPPARQNVCLQNAHVGDKLELWLYGIELPLCS